jgi:hypothetical protein
LRSALAAAQLAPLWVEYQTDDPGLPEHARAFGSPTILVDGKDVAGASAGGSPECCRPYVDESGRRAGAPSIASIVTALAVAQRRQP